MAAERGSLDALLRRLLMAQRAGVLARRNRLARAKSGLEMLSPVACLERGYSIVKDGDGRVVSEASRLSAGDAIHVLLHHGQVEATVESVDAGEAPRSQDA